MVALAALAMTVARMGAADSLVTKPIDVYLIGGQSNATGQGYMRSLPSVFKIDARVLFFHSGYPSLKAARNPIPGFPSARRRNRQAGSRRNWALETAFTY